MFIINIYEKTKIAKFYVLAIVSCINGTILRNK